MYKELITELEKSYPNTALVMRTMTELERERYLAKLELIEHIKLIAEKQYAAK